MNKDINLESFIAKICSDYKLELERSSDSCFKINTDHSSGISIILEVEESYKLSFYFVVRTYDIFYHGDRSDAHVVLSLMFSSFLRLSGIPVSSHLFDIAHPMIENEIWGRYIMPQQNPSFLGISNKEQLLQKVFEILSVVQIWREMLWEFSGCPCDFCMEKDGLEKNRDYKLQDDIIDSIENLYGDLDFINHGSRMRPEWNYLYDMENEITIIESKSLSKFLETILEKRKFPENQIEGINGKLIIDNEINNFIHQDVEQEFKEIINSLDKNKIIKLPIIPLENMLIAVSNPYIIALGRLSGNYEFKSERELVRNRHNNESQILFPIPSFDWEENPCPDQFENLIKSLLERDPNIKTVRKPAPINQGDKSRDLLIEWNILDSQFTSQHHPPTRLIKVVGQCKASKSNIGKSKVIDIRDTVETHNSEGYFLAVSTQITAPLTEKLESLKEKGTWTYWWNREDIELRISKNEDLIPNFPKVFKVSHKIKFVEKE